MGAESRALVTGGAGFIGSHLVAALLDQGIEVDVLDDLSSGDKGNLTAVLDRPGCEFFEGSISDASLVDELVGRSETVYHLAAAVGVELILRHPVGVLESNVLGVQRILESADRHGRKVLFASSSEIYGKGSRVPQSEDDDRVLGPTTRERWSYSSSKAVGEYLMLAYHRSHGVPVVIFRLFNTIGPRQTGRYGMVVPRFVEQARRGDKLQVFGDGRQSRCFCDVADAVRAICALAQEPAAVGQVFNLGGTDEISILELAREVLRLSGETESDDRIRLVPYEEAYALGFEDLRRRVPDTSRIRDLLGWQPKVPLEQTLLQLLDDRDQLD